SEGSGAPILSDLATIRAGERSAVIRWLVSKLPQFGSFGYLSPKCPRDAGINSQRGVLAAITWAGNSSVSTHRQEIPRVRQGIHSPQYERPRTDGGHSFR